MIDGSAIAKESALINAELKEQLKTVFARMQSSVTIKAVVDLAQEKDAEMAAFLTAVAALGEKLELELYTPGEAPDNVPELDTAYLPVTGLYQGGRYGRVCFHGVPGGKETNSFVLAIYNLAGPGQELSKEQAEKISRLTKKAKIKICVSLACHHCPKVVAACQRIAILNPRIEGEMIDAGLYPKLVEKYHITRVPMMIINDHDVHLGAKEMDEIIDLLNV